jgi:hypothetical protein
VVVRHRDADAVGLGVAAALADEEPVVEDVVVAERGALREARGPARVLDVDRVVELGRGLALRELRGADALAAGEELLPVAPDEDDLLEGVEVAADVADHLHVVAALERGGRDQHPAAGLAQHVLELRRPVGRVDVDEDDPGLRRRVLDERPLGAVRAPDPHPVAGLDAGGDERARCAVDGLAELRVRVAEVLMDGDQRLPVSEPLDRAVQVVSDRVAQQGRGRRPRCVRRLHEAPPLAEP